MGEIFKKKIFPYLSEPHTDKLCISVSLKHFWGNSQRTSLFSPKSDYLRKEHRKYSKSCFFNKFEKGQILRKFDLSEKSAEILRKLVFLNKFKIGANPVEIWIF